MLYARLIGRDDAGLEVEGRIPVHFFLALLGEFARGKITAATAQTAIETISGFVLDASERSDATALLNTITGQAAAKLARAKEIDDALMLAEFQVAGYVTPTQVRVRLMGA